MSQPDSLSSPGGYEEQKPASNIYTAMLGVALVALILTSAILAWELNQYDFDYKGLDVNSPSISSTTTAQP
jgi:hypothetical protein